MQTRILLGPNPTVVERRSDLHASGLVIEAPARAWAAPFSPLLRYRPADDACFFANGRGQPNGAVCEGLDYMDGKVTEISVPEFAAPPAPRPRSATAGAAELVAEVRALHNLPALAEGYVERKTLETRLANLLRDRVHRVNTLHGMGGVGKTSLALRVARDLVTDHECPFDLVLWFSSRDVDLLVEGPQPREREVGDIEDVAEMYCRILGGREAGREALQLFGAEVADPRNRMLLIMDNFETLDDPQGVHEYLDASVVMPSKVLITTRLRAFKGDYPLEVSGMEFAEGADLLRMEARRVGCEPKMTAKAIERIYNYTGGAPYAMKLVAAQMGRNLPLDQILDTSLSEDRILEALFRRSFDALSDSARRLFLLVGSLRGDINALPVRALFARSGLSFDAASDECERASLIAVVQEGGYVILRMPQVARKFASRQLPSVEGCLEIERDLEILKRMASSHRASGEPDVLARQVTGQIIKAQTAGERRELTELLEALADQHPSTWRVVAEVRETLDETPESIRDAYQRAARHEPNRADIWQAWARFEGRQGNGRREVELLIRAAECEPENIGLNSHAAYRVAHLISSDLQGFPVPDRAVWISAVKFNLERQFERLDPGPLARLGWLYYLENDRRNAERCARRGLEIEPGHEHCINILRRLGVVR